jgi:Flp pilus assembly protein TadG
VEFALVVPVLLLIVFGIVDYGLYFSNTLASRTGVREAARQATVENFSAGDCSPYTASCDADLRKIACLAIARTGATAGDAYAKVDAPDGWNQGDDVRVCVAVTEQGVTGLTPLPGSGTVRTTLRMRIEQDTVSPSGAGQAGSTGTTTPPGGWSWC